MKQYIYKITFAILFLAALPVIAQQQPATLLVRGQVIDASDNQTIPGATIAEQDSDNRTVGGVVTDFDGNFAIRVKNPNNKLQISTIGYKTKTVAINGKTSIKISLVSSTEQLKEIVVRSEKMSDNGLMSIADRNRTTAAVSINAADLENTQAASIDEALQGRMPGVDIVANSGDPGAGMQIRIRGTSSITGSSDPLIVVDGMPYETSVPDDFNFGSADEQGYAALLNIAPSDIETITILKDAAATAVWGARAASGVLLITTKRGGVSAPKISYSFRGSYSKLPPTIPMLTGDQYSQLIPEAYMNRNGVPLNTLTVKEFQYDPQDVYYYKNYSQNTNWIDAITQTALTGDHNLSLQGGGEKARYFTSVGYYKGRGVTIGTGLERLNARLNLDYVVSDRIRFRTDIAYTHSETLRNYVNSYGTTDRDRLRGVAYTKMPNMSIYEYDEMGNLTPNYFTPASNVQGTYSGTYNPVAMGEYALNTQTEDRIVPHFNVKVDLIPDRLISTFDIQFDFRGLKVHNFLPQSATGRPFTESVVNQAGDSDSDGVGITTKTNFVYTPSIGKNQTLQALLSLQSNDYRSSGHYAMVTNTASSLLTDPSVPGRTSGSGTALSNGNGQSRDVGALVSLQYGLLDRYIVNVGLRGDGNSKFAANNRYGLFPSISTRWRISGEKFMEKFTSIDDLSMRLSYGHSGRAPRYDYRFFNVYDNYNTQYLGLNGVVPGNMELSNLRWEKLIGTNLGFNLQMFNKRLSIDAEIYRNTTKDMLFRDLDISSVSGYSSISDQNVGSMQNQGWEIGLNSTPYKSKKWRVDFNFNISANQNTIKEISEYYPSESGNTDRNGQFKRFLQVDNPFGSFYGYRFKGVYTDLEATKARDAAGNIITGPNGQEVFMRFNYPAVDYTFQPGDAIYEDINKDGNIDSRDVVYLGNSNPKLAGGFGPSISYDKFKLLMYFTYRLNYDIVNGTEMNTTNMYGWSNQSTAVLARWRNPGDVTNMPRAVFGSGYNWLGSDRYVEDASFCRLRSVTLSYNLGKKLLKKLNLEDLRFWVTADNLYTFTKYTGQDPEVSMKGGDPFGIAIDGEATPPTKRFTFGLTTRF
ncbi:SusC/RagA family TonB-linked outer membrane protein [Flavobacterium sp. L1I52]|uniref:SusC/RagA family TonB-linked outer membrane protein n=1 Tax=Flavobacterium pokkalii TaxID=1940408 RepID=A0ABR7UPR6_9FLAO|nr:SusC/RagA family TonB-linked outer membrane protein [Flavobacterium pokkalii]KQB38126.1 putative outer membrane protein [Flavobacterium daejeonense]MBD0724235.1 SusC/RagA family TonB-linked outer membrane protein [Flavobacterium pokkalii]